MTCRAFIQGVALAAAVFLSFQPAAFPEPGGDVPELVVLARATSIVLTARQTHVVLAPVPPPRRQQTARPKTKGAKPAPPRMQLVLRDVVVRDGASAYDVFLVLEGPNVFEATTTKVQIGALEGGRASGDSDSGSRKGGGKGVIITLDANDAFAQFAKIRGFNVRHLRVVIARTGVKDEQGKETVPPDPVPPEIGAIELVRS